jgi:hypothetical protein
MDRPPVDARWRARPAPKLVLAALLAAIIVTPTWILIDDLRNFALIRDDFDYVSQARDWPTARAHLLEAHNTHVVPVFRLWTFVLASLAGRLSNLPAVFAAGSYLALIAAMLAVGHVVARETGRTASGLAAMAIIGISTVSYPTVTWYSASQALSAGVGVVVTIALAQSWAREGGVVRFAGVVLGAIVSPAIWSGGLVAGPAASAYLYAKKGPRAHGPAALLLGITIAAGLLIVALSQGNLQLTKNVWAQHPSLWPRPVQGLLHTAQALSEVCLFGNLGVDAVTTPGQAVALLVALATLHAWSRGGPARFNPLEAAGATIAVGSGLIEYTFRGNLPYSSLRALSWYYAIPQVGAILFLAGWWTALRGGLSGRMTLGQVAGIGGLVVVFCAIHIPHWRQQWIDAAPPFAPDEALVFPTSELRFERALYHRQEFHRLQLRALARLDRVDRILAQVGASPDTVRDFVGRITIPGIPEQQRTTDALAILLPRARNPNSLDALVAHRVEIIDLLRPEPEPVPFWLDPQNPLSRAVREVSQPKTAPDPFSRKPGVER